MSPGTDSAGTPWDGRRFEANSFSADDGRAANEVIQALATFAGDRTAVTGVVDSLRHSRLLIPLVAHLGESGLDESGRLVDKTQELSIVTVAGPDGRIVMPVFSSVDAMREWNPAARPVPADGERVALAAAAEGTDLVVLDPTSETEFVVRRPALWAIAQNEAWTPSYLDPEVFTAFADSIASELGALDIALSAGDPDCRLRGPELVIRLTLAQGLSQEELDAMLARLAQRWAASDVIATRVDSLRVQLGSRD